MPGYQPPTARDPAPLPRVRVRRDGDHRCVVAAVLLRAGETILEIGGPIVAAPTRHTLQVDTGAHVTTPTGLSEADLEARCPWRFLDHSCAANTVVIGRQLIAIDDIAAGAAVTFDYNTTEYEMAHPFQCHCGASHCLGVIAGFRFLTREQRELRRPLLAAHLRRCLDEPTELPAR